MTSYSNIFGGPNVQPATISYAIYGTVALPFNANLTLNWATSYVDNNYPVAQIMDVNPTMNGLTLTMPDAMQNSVGQVSQINNISAFTLSILKNDGSALTTVAPARSVEIYLTDNSTVAGTWNNIQSGAVPSAADAAILAGSGLVAIGTTLNTNIPSTVINGNYTATVADRSKLFVWQGGTGTITLPAYAAVTTNPPIGWDIAFNNSGTGVLNIVTPDGSQFDATGSTTFTLNPGQSSNFVASGAFIAGPTYLWNSLGYGQETFFSFNALVLDIAAGGTFVLTAQQSSRQIIKFTGNLAQAAIIQFPVAPGAWYVYNMTNGAFTVTVELVGGVSPIVLPPGARYIIYSDGSNLYNTPTVVTSVVFADGSAGAPSIGFGSDTTSGFYKVSSGIMGYSSLTNPICQFSPSGIGLVAGKSLTIVNAANTFYTSLNSTATSTAAFSLPQAYPTVDNQLMYGTMAGQWNFTTATYPLTTVAHQLLYSSATNTITGLATANNGVLITSAGGVPSISSTLPSAVQSNITTVGTVTAGIWNGNAIDVAHGGTGVNGIPAYQLVAAGTTNTGPIAAVGAGTAGQVLTSNGPGVYPSFETFGGISTYAFFAPNPINIYKSLNIPLNGIVRNSAGYYTVTFVNPYSDATYITMINAEGTIFDTAFVVQTQPFVDTLNIFIYSNNAAFDPTYITLMIIGS